MEQNRFGPPGSGNDSPRGGNDLSSSGLGSTGIGSGGLGSNGLTSSDLGSPGLGSTGLGIGSQPTPGTGEQLKVQGQRAAGVVAEKMKEKVAGVVDQRKIETSGNLQQIAGALRDVGHTLEGNGLGAVGRVTDRAAEQVERTADYLRRRDFDGLVRDTRDFARNHPEIFVGGAVLAGVLLGRFLRSSSPTPDLERSSEPGQFAEPSSSYPPPGGWA